MADVMEVLSLLVKEKSNFCVKRQFTLGTWYWIIDVEKADKEVMKKLADLDVDFRVTDGKLKIIV